VQLVIILETVDRKRTTAMALQQGLEWFRLSRDKEGLSALLIGEERPGS
jgi:hypothetical protein